MNDVSIHVPYIFSNKQNSLDRGREKKTVTEGRQRNLVPREARGRP